MKLLSAVYFIFMAALTIGPGQAKAEALRVGISGLSTEFTSVWAAHDRGIFKKYGFETEVIAMQGGTQLASAIIGGSLSVAVMGGAYLTAAVRGADLVMIATHMDKFPYSLIVKPAIKKTEDLKGAKLAISRFGTASDAALRVSLQKLGMNPDKDVTILQIGGQTSRFAALKAGTVDGTVVIPPLSSAAQRLGYNSLFSMAKLGIPYPQEGVVVSRQYLTSHREAALRFLKAFVEGLHAIKTEKEFAIAVMAKNLRMDPKKDREALEDSFQEVIMDQMLRVPLVNIEAVKAAIDLLGKDRPAQASTNPRDYVDASLMQELVKSGFTDALYKQEKKN